MCGLHPITNERVFREEVKSRRIEYTQHFESERLPYQENVSDDDREKYEVLFDMSSSCLDIVYSLMWVYWR